MCIIVDIRCSVTAAPLQNVEPGSRPPPVELLLLVLLTPGYEVILMWSVERLDGEWSWDSDRGYLFHFEKRKLFSDFSSSGVSAFSEVLATGAVPL